MTAAELADRLGAKRSGTGWTARCPAHEDRTPSLSITEGDNGGTVMHCHAGCTTEDIVKALDLTMKDLAPPLSGNGHDETIYRYTDENGTLLFEVVRKPGKQFSQRPANGKPGPGAMQGVPLVLYRLPRVRKAVANGNTILICEGEKDAERAVAEGYCATTNPMGAGKWGKIEEHACQVLAGADVIVVRDRDDPGLAHADQVVASLRGVARSVMLVEPAEGKDLSDHIAAGHTIDDLYEVKGETAKLPLTLIDWSVAFHRPAVDALVDGLVFPGRWTAKVAPAKLGKSTLELHIAHCLARGLSPFLGTRQPPFDVLYLDGEMGELDVLERLEALDLNPADLPHLHYTDLFPKGDTIQGGAAIVSTALALKVAVVILDGMNAFVTGAEKDDTPWRNLFEQTIAPLKRAGIAVLSTDNTGKDVTLSARGSSVKLDKADAIVMLKRTDNGLNLRTTHQRTSGYLRTLDLAMTGLTGDEPINYRQTSSAWPAGTHDAVALLDSLGIAIDTGRERTRAALKTAGHKLRNDVLSAAIRYRKTCPGQVAMTDLGTTEGDR